MVTEVLGSTPPEVSETVPVMPPRVCWASAMGTDTKTRKRSDARKKADGLILLHIRATLPVTTSYAEQTHKTKWAEPGSRRADRNIVVLAIGAVQAALRGPTINNCCTLS